MANSSSDSLFELIHSLSKTEKRFFNLYVNRHTIGAENNSQIIFDFIAKMNAYDESVIFQEFKGKSFLNKFSITKHRLYHLILESLNHYHARTSVESELNNSLQSAEILFTKGLYNQSKKLTSGIIKKAKRHHLSQIKWQAMLLNRKMHEQNFYTSLSQKEIAALQNQENQEVRIMQIKTDLWHIKASLFREIHAIGTIRSDVQVEKLNSIVEPLKNIHDEIKTAENEYLYHQILSAYNFAVYNMEQCYLHLSEIRNIYKLNEHLFNKSEGKYLSVLTNLIYVCIKVNRFAEAEIYLAEVEALNEFFTKSIDLKVKYFSSYYSLKLFVYIEKGNDESVDQVLDSVKLGLIEFADKINPVRKAYFYFQLGVYYLANNEYKMALDCINGVLNDKQNLAKEDIYSFAQILQLIIHFELKNYRYLPYVLTSTKRFLKDKNRHYEFEKIFLKIIGKIKSETITTLELEDILIDFEPEITKLKNDKFEKVAFEYFDFGAWLKSKIQRKTYLEIKKASA